MLWDVQKKRDRKTAQAEANAKAALAAQAAAEERKKNVDELSSIFTDFMIGNGYWSGKLHLITVSEYLIHRLVIPSCFF